MSVPRDEFDALVSRVASLERQNRAMISLLSEQVVTIVPTIERTTAELGDSIGELAVYVHDEFGKLDHKVDDIIRRLGGGQ